MINGLGERFSTWGMLTPGGTRAVSRVYAKVKASDDFRFGGTQLPKG